MDEPTTVGLSDAAHAKLRQLKEDGFFAEMSEGYRFAVSLALANGIKPSKKKVSRGTIFNVGTLDPDQTLYNVVAILRDDDSEPVWKTVEKLAEWGVDELSKLSQQGDISFSEIFDKFENK